MISILCFVVLICSVANVLGCYLVFSYLSFDELLKAQHSVIIQNLKNWRYFWNFWLQQNTQYKNCSFLKPLSARYGESKLFFKRKTKFRKTFNCVAVTISTISLRLCEDFAVHWEMLNCFKGLSLFFHSTTFNIPFQQYWAGSSCL